MMYKPQPAPSPLPSPAPHRRRCHAAFPILAAVWVGCVALSPAVADSVPEPPAACVGKPDGTFCALPDGTAGLCATQKDARRPGRSYQTCMKDAHECDKLAIGAVCHGYLGKPSHCREFQNAERGERWRTCQADDPPPAAPSSVEPAAPDSPAAAAAPSPSAPARKGLFGCQLAGGSPGGGLGGGFSGASLGVVAGLLAALLGRRRRQKNLG